MYRGDDPDGRRRRANQNRMAAFNKATLERTVGAGRLTWFYAEALRAHLLRLATRAGLVTISGSSGVARFV